jgi:hypothetical protein
MYYSRYDNFIKGLFKELLEDVDYKFVTATGGMKRKNERDQYSVSFDGLK